MQNMPQYVPVVKKIQSLPEPLLREVDDFVDFLLARYDLSTTSVDEELSATTMSYLSATGGSFNWLNESAEDIYSDDDGEAV